MEDDTLTQRATATALHRYPVKRSPRINSAHIVLAFLFATVTAWRTSPLRRRGKAIRSQSPEAPPLTGTASTTLVLNDGVTGVNTAERLTREQAVEIQLLKKQGRPSRHSVREMRLSLNTRAAVSA